jgi:hypothetical protein
VLAVHLLETGLREHVEPILQWLLAHDDCLILIVVRSGQREEFIRSSTLPLAEHPRLKVVVEERFLAKLIHPGVLLTLHPETRSRVADAWGDGRVFRVAMQHGLPDKEVFFVPDGRGDTLGCYDGLFLYGPASRNGSLRLYAQRYPDNYRRLQLFDVGYPKTDSLKSSEAVRNEVLRGLGLAPERPTICYAPTYQRTASLEWQGSEIIRGLASLDVNLIVKLHHVSLKRPGPDLEKWVMAETGGKDWRAILRTIERNHPNVRLAPSHDANPYLIAADVLVTDVSGVAFEFLLLDRPIVFFDVPELFDQFGRTGLHFTGRSCGQIVSSVEQMCEGVRLALANPQIGRDRRQELRDRLVYNPGTATEVAGRTLQALMRRR